MVVYTKEKGYISKFSDILLKALTLIVFSCWQLNVVIFRIFKASVFGDDKKPGIESHTWFKNGISSSKNSKFQVIQCFTG